MEEISPDIEQWLLQDSQVVSRWRQLARLLDLDDCLLECQKWEERRGRRRRWNEKDNMEMMLRGWRKKSPESYNILNLKSILLAEGLYDMWMWLNIITQDTTRPRSVMSSPTPSPTPSSPWSRYLYSPSHRNCSVSSPPPYTESDYAHSLSSGGSRSPSQLSEHKSNTNTTPISFSSTPTTTTTSNTSILCRPDLIQLSSPRHWSRQSYEETSRHLAFESAGCDMSAMSDKWESLEIIEHENNDLCANEELGENTKHDEINNYCSAVTGDQSSKFNSKNISNFKTRKEKCETNERYYIKNDKDVIDSVNRMNTELQVNTEVPTRRQENKMKKVKFVKDDEFEYEKQFDSILSMIQQAVAELNV